MTTPQPRVGRFMGMEAHPVLYPDGTWIEGEEWCYPDGGYSRFAWAECEDGKRRRVKCSVADTFFSIPAYVIGGPKGFLSVQSGGLLFTETKHKETQ